MRNPMATGIPQANAEASALNGAMGEGFKKAQPGAVDGTAFAEAFNGAALAGAPGAQNAGADASVPQSASRSASSQDSASALNAQAELAALLDGAKARASNPSEGSDSKRNAQSEALAALASVNAVPGASVIQVSPSGVIQVQSQDKGVASAQAAENSAQASGLLEQTKASPQIGRGRIDLSALPGSVPPAVLASALKAQTQKTPAQQAVDPSASTVLPGALSATGDLDVEILDASARPGDSAMGVKKAENTFGKHSKLGGDEFLKLAQAGLNANLQVNAVKSVAKQGASLQSSESARFGAESSMLPASALLKFTEPKAGDSVSGAGVIGLTGQTVVTSERAKADEPARAARTLDAQAIEQLTSGILKVSDSAQTGEIRMRVRPEQLGELMIHISTHGKDVELKVKASSHEARKIFEESISSLKESLRQHQLSLGAVDLGVAAPVASAPDSSSMHFNLDRGHQGQPHQHFGQDQESGSRRAPRFEDGMAGSQNRNVGFNPALRTRVASAAGRIDVVV